MHTKFLIFDDYAYLGSANISNNSKNNLIEAGVIFFRNSEAVIFEELELILKSILEDEETIQVGQDQIDQLSKIEVKKPEIINRNKFYLKEKNTKYWALGIYQEAYYPGDIVQVGEEATLYLQNDEKENWFFFKQNHARTMFKSCGVGDIVAMFTRNKKIDPIDVIHLVKITRIQDDEYKNKICFYKILKTIQVNQYKSIFNNQLNNLYRVKWIGRGLKDYEINYIKNTFLDA